MAEDFGAGVRAWTDVVRRSRLGRTTKLVALLMANYADSDGTRVFPGIARIAVEAELTYNVVKESLAELRNAGLLELVHQATRRGDSDEYRLTLGPDLMDRIEVLSPSEVTVAIEKMRDQRRGKHRPKAGGLRPTAQAADEEAAAHGVYAETEPAAHGVATCGPRRYPPPTTTETQLPPTTPTADLRTAHRGPRASGTSPPKTRVIPSSSNRMITTEEVHHPWRTDPAKGSNRGRARSARCRAGFTTTATETAVTTPTRCRAGC